MKGGGGKGGKGGILFDLGSWGNLLHLGHRENFGNFRHREKNNALYLYIQGTNVF